MSLNTSSLNTSYKVLRSRAGMSLIELLMTVAIATVGGLVAATFLSRLVNVWTLGLYETNYLQVNEAMLKMLGTPDLCPIAVGVPSAIATHTGGPTVQPVKFDYTAARTANGMPFKIYLTGSTDMGTKPIPGASDLSVIDVESPTAHSKTYDNYAVSVTSLALVGATQIPLTAPIGTTAALYSVIVQAIYSPANSNITAALNKQLISSLTISVDASGNINGCAPAIAAYQDPEKFCAQMPAPTRVFVGAGSPAMVNGLGNSYSPDANGCIDARAFQGPDQPAPAPPPPPPFIPPYTPPTPKSDARVKENIAEFSYGLPEVARVNPVWFRYNGLAQTPAGELHAGVLAQELRRVAPLFVDSSLEKLRPEDREKSDVLRVHYSDFRIMLLKAVQEQQRQIEDLKRELETQDQPQTGPYGF